MADADDATRVTFRDVKAHILQRISDRSWPPGALIPGEVDLAQAFGCARATVNRAMRELTEEGILDRRRKAGTRVRLSPLQQARFDIPTPRDAILAGGARYELRILGQSGTTAPDWLCRALGLPPGAPVLHVIACHLADDIPDQMEDRWISLTALPQAAEADLAATGPTEWLIATIPFSEVEMRLTAIATDPDTARHMDWVAGTPHLAIERLTRWNGQPVTFVRMHHRPGFAMATRY